MFQPFAVTVSNINFTSNSEKSQFMVEVFFHQHKWLHEKHPLEQLRGRLMECPPGNQPEPSCLRFAGQKFAWSKSMLGEIHMFLLNDSMFTVTKSQKLSPRGIRSI